MMLNVNELIGFGVGGEAPFEVTLLETRTSTSAGPTFTFTGFSAPSGGLVVALFAKGGGTASTPSSAIIDGGSASTIKNSTNNAVGSMIAYAEIASARIFDLSFTFSTGSGGSPGSVLAVYLITGYKSVTPIDTDFPATSSTSSRTLSLDTQEDGAAFYVSSNASSSTTNVTWSSITPDIESTVGLCRGELGKFTPTIDALNRTETITYGAATQNSCLAASWR